MQEKWFWKKHEINEGIKRSKINVGMTWVDVKQIKGKQIKKKGAAWKVKCEREIKH